MTLNTLSIIDWDTLFCQYTDLDNPFLTCMVACLGGGCSDANLTRMVIKNLKLQELTNHIPMKGNVSLRDNTAMIFYLHFYQIYCYIIVMRRVYQGLCWARGVPLPRMLCFNFFTMLRLFFQYFQNKTVLHYHFS